MIDSLFSCNWIFICAFSFCIHHAHLWVWMKTVANNTQHAVT